MFRMVFGYIGVCCLSFAGAGCGGTAAYEGPERAPVQGKVSFDGEPVSNGSITFVPQGEGRKVSGTITDGAYALSEELGPNLGPQRVEILWAKPTGKKTVYEGEQVDVTKQVIPAKYNTNTELTADVTGEESVFNFDLKSK